MNDIEFIREILTKDDTASSITDNLDTLITIIPEIEPMIGFEHKHPHHYLDVWDHTVKVIKKLNTTDFELNLAALLHDIGKPFSYQDEEVRHFRGHPAVSAEISEKILSRLNIEGQMRDDILYLIRMHDTAIEPDKLDNSMPLIRKRLKLQYADARAHSPKKVAKRITLLDDITRRIDKLEEMER